MAGRILRRKYVTTQDIVIPKGTIVGPAPSRTIYAVPFSSALVSFDADTTADLRFDTEEALELGLIKEI